MDKLQEAKIDLLLMDLKLPMIRKTYAKLKDEIAKAGGDYFTYLEALLREESSDRQTRRLHRRVKEAHFPQQKLMSDLEEQALPEGIKLAQLQELSNCSYIEEGTNVIAIGGSGTGKSHVSIALGIAACQQNKRVRFFTATELVCELEAAQENHTLMKMINRLARQDLLIIDELGYLPITERGAQLLFQVLSTRHEGKSTILNSNLPFSDWGQIFKCERMTVALLDRVTHNAHVLEMNGESYRLRSAKKRRSSSS